MKAVIFAGGAGTRLWPLSRKKSPKQFEKIIGDKSTLQLAAERLMPEFRPEDIYISTNERYKKIIEEQLPQIPKKNFIFEPEKKDVGPAIALVMGLFSLQFGNEPVLILWSDHLVKKNDLFKKIIKIAGKEIEKVNERIIFIAHKPRYPSVNLGYIHIDKKIREVNEIAFYKFLGFKYKPDEDLAKQFYRSSSYAWNLGYFVTSPLFIYNAFKQLAPNIYQNIEKIVKSYGTKNYDKNLKKYYHLIEPINFDNAILENLDKKYAEVVVEDIGWSDVGAWEALKEALETFPYENVIRGRVFLDHVRDSLVYNYEDKKFIVGIDLDETIIVNTNDVLLITKKSSVSKIKTLVESFEGTENETLI
jgi:mannose-1-phosphate guanylyltransferase